MAPLANAAGTWVRLDRLAKLIGLHESTLWRRRALSKIETREQLADGRRFVEVLVDSLPTMEQQKYANESARISSAATEAARALDDALHVELSSEEVRNRLARFDDITRLAFKREATRRRELLQMWADSPAKKIGGEWSPAARSIMQEWACPDPLVLAARPSWGEPGTPPTIYRQSQRLQQLGILGLLPEAPKAKRVDDRRLCRLHPDVVDEIRRLRLIRHTSATLASLYRKLLAKFGDDAPSESTFKRLLARDVTKGDMILARDGDRAFNGKAAAFINRDYSQLDVGEWICGDEHQFDVFIINPYRNGELDRPWVTMFIDLRTRAPMGWTISFEHNTQTIVEAFIHAVRPKQHEAFEHLCGLPAAVYIDNGKDYRSTRFDFMLAQHKIEVHHALPFNAKAKNVERFFGTLCQQFSRDQKGYCGNKPEARPGRFHELEAEHARWLANKPGAKTAFMTLSAFKVAFAEFAVSFITREHHGLFEWETGRARSPMAVAGDRRQAPRVPSHEVLEYIAMPRFERTVKRGQISIDNVFYRDDELMRLDGRKVNCRRSPADITELFVYTDKDEFLCIAKAAPVIPTLTGGITADGLKEIARKRREDQKVRDRYYELRDREMEGDNDATLPPPRDPEPATLASPSDVAPVAAVIEFVAPAARAIRAARTARASLPKGGGQHEAAVATTGGAAEPADHADDEFLSEQLGPRPAIDKFDPPSVKAEKLDGQRQWDEAREWLLADLRAKRALQR